MSADTWGTSWGGTTGSWLASWAAAFIEVPDVTGNTQGDGTTTLEAAGFVVAVANAYSSTVVAGSIISQSPLAGAQAPSGSTVTITVSLGDAPAQNKGGRRKRRRLFVDVDGQSFPVASASDAYAILESARALAAQQAPALARKAVRRALRKQQPPVAILPTIVVPQEYRTQLQPLREQILALYQQALLDEEIRIRLERNARAEDEEDVLSLLLM